MKNRKARVLLVEDEQSLAEVLAALLEMEGYDVTVAFNGQVGLDLVETTQPELIITDYMMPVMNGVEMARCVRLVPGLGTLPILMTSAVSEKEIGTGRSLLTAFMRKPVEFDLLLDEVSGLLANRASSQDPK